MSNQLDTTNWVSYPFEVNGIKFKSMLDPKGNFYPRVELLPKKVFTEENIKMVLELIGNPAEFTTDELQIELDICNAGATQALVCLA